MPCLVVVDQAKLQHRGREQKPVGLACSPGGDNMVDHVASNGFAHGMDACGLL